MPYDPELPNYFPWPPPWWPEEPPKKLKVEVSPYPALVDTNLIVLVTAVDSETGAPVDGIVYQDEFIIGHTNRVFNWSFCRSKILTGEGPYYYVDGDFGSYSITAEGYDTEYLNFRLPDDIPDRTLPERN